ncbi:MAG TPA: ABC-F family ATP-binding cassette domain-containing protein [Bacillota bacterium]|nr:ABC-F family ATP-binding cassette domain-containing protein [Bacillota bacterium]
MVLLQANELAKSIGVNQIFDQVSFILHKGEKVGLVGVNGAGKSTLLRILAGLDEADRGRVTTAQGVKVGYLAQHFVPDFAGTVWELMMAEFAHLAAMKAGLAALEGEMASPEVYTDEARLQKAMTRYSELTHEYESSGGYSCESRVRGILAGLGFGAEDYGRKVTEFSGGQQTRLGLARLLLTQPEVLLLDEPTNHLDINTVEWLESFLEDYQGAVLLVSHDRYFLDKTADRIFDLEAGSLRDYNGNFSRFQVTKAQLQAAQQKEFDRQQAKIARLEAYIERFRAGIKSKQARGRQSQLERMATVAAPVQLRNDMDWKLAPKKAGGQIVLTVEQLTAGYDKPLIDNFNLTITRGEKVAIIGANGSGKSTLLKTVTGNLPQLAGRISLGSQISIGYFAQDQGDNLHENSTLIQAVQAVEPMSEGAERNFLANLLFIGDDVFKQVANLSGGERARLVLAQMLLQGDNFLVLDEPTNHLDMQAKEVLEEGLCEYTGSALVVSHDRYFLDQTVSRIIEVDEEGKTTEYLGDYTYYRWKKQQLAEEAQREEQTRSAQAKGGQPEKAAQEGKGGQGGKPAQGGQGRKGKGPTPGELEAEITAVEARMEEVSELLAQPETYRAEDGGRSLVDELKSLEARLEELYSLWESII